MNMAGASKPGKIQVLGVQLDSEEVIRLEDRTDSLVGQLMGRVSFVFAVKQEDPLLGQRTLGIKGRCKDQHQY
jgi:hypothetical protein